MEFKAHDYQRYVIDRVEKNKKVFEILDMGLGKTVCTLTAINDLMFEAFEISKVLVIAPLRVAESTWPDEIEKWDHLKNLKIAKVIGTEAQREKALTARADIWTINRENVKWLVDYQSKKKTWPFDCIVIDESSSFKNQQSQRFKALRKVTGITERVYLLTGTPAPNTLMDLWPQLFLLDRGERLGKTITQYRNEYFTPGRRNQQIIFDYKLRLGADKQIYKQIDDLTISLSAADHLKMPERIDNTILVKLGKKERTMYDKLEEDCVLQLEKEETITAGSRAVVTNKLLQFANGAIYDENRKVAEIHDLKLDALEEIIEDNEGKPILVFYNFQHDLERLQKRFQDRQPRLLQTREDLKDWNEGKIMLLFAHPAAMGHGLNLQSGGNIIVWFGLTWSLELYLQANARLYRQGQKNETVVINHIVAAGTVDEDVMRALQGKKISQDELIEAVKAKINAKRQKE